MGSAKYWGDEKLPDALYGIYLRKVRYVSPNNYKGIAHFRPLDPDVGAEDLAHLQWETVKERVIKAGSLAKLIECLLLPDGELDTRHFNVFFTTYRPFAAAFDVLRLLLARYSDVATGADQVKKMSSRRKATMLNSLRSVLTCWMDLYPDDFCERSTNFPCLVQIIEFARQYPVHLNELSNKARRLNERFKIEHKNGHWSSDKATEIFELDHNSNPMPPTVEYLDFLLSPVHHRPSEIVDVDHCLVAEQLTYWDAYLFKKLLPHQCQGYFWSKRMKNKAKMEHVATVKATIDQFNAVVKRVMASVVYPECRHPHRAKIVSKWIEIARQLRLLKNFSSLKAVLSTLQSEPVHRLKLTWTLVANDLYTEFEQLSKLFNPNEEDGGVTAKEVLEQEGTAKSTNPSPLRPYGKHRRAKSDMGEIQGTVPYLGSFLTEMTTIEEFPDYTDDGLINFEKRRKEFEVLAKLKLYQSAAQTYNIEKNDNFVLWFSHLPHMNEKDCYRRSLEIEPLLTSTPKEIRKSSTLSRILGLNFLDGDNVGPEDNWFSVTDSTMSRSGTDPQIVGHSVFYSYSEFDPRRAFLYPRPLPTSNYTPTCQPKARSLIGASHSHSRTPSATTAVSSNRSSAEYDSVSSETTPSPSAEKLPPKSSSFPEAKLIRVGPDDSLQTEKNSGAPNYVSVRLDSSDRVVGVIEKALQKLHTVTGGHGDFCLVQLLPDGGEFALPENCNPFYASKPDDSTHILNFILRPKITDGKTTVSKKFCRKKKVNPYLEKVTRWSSCVNISS